MYTAQRYSDSEIQSHTDLVYSTRPNEGEQFTDDETKSQELTAPTLSLRLDIHVPPGASATTPRPLLLWIHGGGLVEGGKSVLKPFALTYARAGYVVAMADYRLSPRLARNWSLYNHVMGQAAEDTMNAVRWLRVHAAEYGIDTQRIALMGYSSGGAVVLAHAIAADELDTAVSDFPGVSSRVSGVVSTGATLVNDHWDSDAMLHYDATDAQVMLMHANPNDPVDHTTWDGNVIPSKARVDASGNRCDAVAQPDGTHMADITQGGAFSSSIDPFLQRVLRLP
ncbi:MAG TPA: alpha/beta hydrolase [Ideonella sp.]|nr:alpha/beta hydrolase [Ideonella sp.]